MRQAIPRKLKRKILIESGHRCAIPTCRQVPVEIAHIEPWSKVKEHTFENLIALCPTCHTRFDRGEIDKQSMIQYKSNLCIINQRYGDLEKRVLEYFIENPDKIQIYLPYDFDLMLKYLIKDKLLIDTNSTVITVNADRPHAKLYKITEKGKLYIKNLATGIKIT